jgi:beta-galactosidase
MNRKQELGVCYYPEHWPESRWPVDARLMREAGIGFVRIGEFAWSRLEPDPGRYDFDWLEQAIDTLHAAGLKIVLGTPTATPPKWLVDTMPDMLAVDASGRVRGFGSRRHYCFSHQGYRRECACIVTALAERFGGHEGVAAWQTDNEYGCHDTVASYSEAARLGFRDWLAQKYQSPEALNRAWGTVFWSMEYRNFHEVELPNLTVTETAPAHRLDFQRYSSDQVVSFNRLQTEIIRKHAPGRTILHNFMGSFLAFDHYAVSTDLDAASWDSYPLGFLDRDAGDPERRQRYMRVGDPDHQAFHHDLYRACGRGRWWVMEQQPGPVNWAPHNPAPAPGAIRLWAWEAFAAGAEVVSYFRWRQAPFGQEQMHEGLRLPDGSPNEAYDVVQSVAREIAETGASVETSRAEVAIIFDYESAWAWSIQPQGRSFSYLGLVLRFYRALRACGISVDVIPPVADAVRPYPLVLAPGLFSVSVALADALAEDDRIVLLGPRTGSRTPDFRIPDALPPGDGLQRKIPLKIRRSETFAPPSVIVVDEPGKGCAFETWREFVQPTGTLKIIDRCLDGETAFCSDPEGRVHYLAGQPNAAYASQIVERLCSAARIRVERLHRDIRIRDNGAVRYIFNYGPETVDIRQWTHGRPLVLGSDQLEPCGVAAFRQDGQHEA